MYYLQSRYYDPAIGRFISADSQVSTGQGFIGYDAYTYCLNNPINYIDDCGYQAIAIQETAQWWAYYMGWLCAVDAALPCGDLIYLGGAVILASIAVYASDDSSPYEISIDNAGIAYDPPSPNNDDDDDNDDDDYDDYDDYYDDDSNFGGRQRMGKSRGNAPRNNQTQNKQFKDATKGLSKDQKRTIHDQISHEGYGYQGIKSLADAVKSVGKTIVSFVFGLFGLANKAD